MDFLNTIRQWADENPTQPITSGLYRRRTDGRIMRMTRYNTSPWMLHCREDNGVYDAAGFDVVLDDKQQN